MSIIKYSPFAGFDGGFPSSMRMFEDSVSRLLSEHNGRPWVPPVDIQETDQQLIVKADVPDIDTKDLDVRMENGTLTIRGRRNFEAKKDEGGWHRMERSYGSFERAFTVPDTIDPEGIKADYKNGVLTITLAKKEVAKPRQIKVDVSSAN